MSMAEPGTRHPLSGLRVLDMSRILAGPFATQTLSDLGADVLKIEHPKGGDDTRRWGPPFLTGEDGAEVAAYFTAANRGKRSLALDFTTEEGAALLRRLAARADVLVENYKVGGLEKYGLDHASLGETNPGLVYCSITGFGQEGPYAARAGYDFMIQGMGGLMSITGEPDGVPGGGPVKVGVAVADLFTGLYATIAILAALEARRATGRGQHIDMALMDCQTAMLANQAANYLVTGESPPRLGNAHPNIVPYEAFETADFPIILAIGNDAQFERFVSLAGQPDLARDPRFASNANRVAHRAILVPIVAGLMKARTRTDWLNALEAHGIPAGPVNDLGQVFTDPQILYRGMACAADHARLGAVPMVASPIRLSDTPVRAPKAPPLLGEGGAEALIEWLGPDADRPR